MRNLHTNLNIAMIKHNNSSGIADVFMQWFPRYICILYMNAQLIGCYVYVIQYKRPHQRYMNRSIGLIAYYLIHFVQSNFRKEFFAWIRKKKILPLRATRYLFPCYIRVLRRARIKRHFAIRDRTFHIRNRKKVEGRSIEMLEVKYWKFDRTTELSPRNDTHFSAF